MFFSTSVQPTSQSEQRLAGHKPLEPARVLLKAFRITTWSDCIKPETRALSSRAERLGNSSARVAQERGVEGPRRLVKREKRIKAF